MASLNDLIVRGVARIVGKIYSAGGFVGDLEGTASKATADASGNVISTSYAKTSHNQASNTITAMTGYSKPSSASAIATGDSLNSAIGKLEKKLDGVNVSTVTVTANTSSTPSLHTTYVINGAYTLSLVKPSEAGLHITVVGLNANSTVTYSNIQGTSVKIILGAGGIVTLISAGNGYADLMYNAVWN